MGAALNMPANLENSAVATGLEKASFHSNPKERQCQRIKADGRGDGHERQWAGEVGDPPSVGLSCLLVVPSPPLFGKILFSKPSSIPGPLLASVPTPSPDAPSFLSVSPLLSRSCSLPFSRVLALSHSLPFLLSPPHGTAAAHRLREQLIFRTSLLPDWS